MSGMIGLCLRALAGTAQVPMVASDLLCGEAPGPARCLRLICPYFLLSFAKHALASVKTLYTTLEDPARL